MIYKKTIHQMPVDRGPYVPETIYYLGNEVRLYNCVFRSKENNNTNAPAVIDEENHRIIFDYANWEVIHDGSEAFLHSHFKDDYIATVAETESAIDELT